MPTLADALPRRVRLTFAYSSHHVDAIARQAGLTLSEAETAAILDHIDREIDFVARSAATAAMEARIAALVDVVQSTHPTSERRISRGSSWPRRLSMC